MRVTVLDNAFDVSRDRASVEEAFRYVDEALQAAERRYDYAIVDGQEVFNDLHHYLLERLEFVQTVEIVSVSQEEWADNLVKTAVEYIGKAVIGVQGLADQFYRGEQYIEWSSVEDLVEGMQWITSVMTVLRAHDTGNLAQLDNDLNLALKQLLTAVETKDYSLAGDTLHYEIIPRLEELHDVLAAF